MEVERPKGYPEGPETPRGRFANDRIAGPGVGKWKSPRHLISFLLGLVVMRLALSYDVPSAPSWAYFGLPQAPT